MTSTSRLRLSIFLTAAASLALAGCAHAPQASARATPPRAAAAAAPGWQLDWARGATFYEIFVRSFADSDGDGVGDLRGLTAHLDYLNDGDPATTTDLGVEGLWLMPIFASPSYHGYDTVDYRTINPAYGTMEDFETFIAAAHKRGIKVIVDLVINHTGADHPWFVDSASSPASPKRDWYVWRADDPGWKQPWGGGPTWHEKNGAYYYGIFWSGMPDLNLAQPRGAGGGGRDRRLLARARRRRFPARRGAAHRRRRARRGAERLARDTRVLETVLGARPLGRPQGVAGRRELDDQREDRAVLRLHRHGGRAAMSCQ